MLKTLIIKWAIEAAFDYLVEAGEKLAKRSDTKIDDEAIQKLKESREFFIRFAKGKL